MPTYRYELDQETEAALQEAISTLYSDRRPPAERIAIDAETIHCVKTALLAAAVKAVAQEVIEKGQWPKPLFISFREASTEERFAWRQANDGRWPPAWGPAPVPPAAS